MEIPAPKAWESWLTGLGPLLHRHFLLVLLACYALAAYFPEPGLAVRQAVVLLPTGETQHVPVLLLALLIFCAAISLNWEQVRDIFEHPGVTVTMLVAVWLGPSLAVAGLADLLPRVATQESTSGLLVGLAIVAAMPVANSSAGWSQSSGGNVALSLGLVVLSIVLSPLATPQTLRLMGLVLPAADAEKIESLIAEFSGWRFIAWVVLPSAAGAGVAWLLGRARILVVQPWIRMATLINLLLLNYTNAALAFPKVLQEDLVEVTIAATGLAISVSLVGLALASILPRLLRLSGDSRVSILYGLSMKHTGLALVLAGEVLGDFPRVILVIVLATLTQHLVAAAIDAVLMRRGHGASEEGIANPSPPGN